MFIKNIFHARRCALFSVLVGVAIFGAMPVIAAQSSQDSGDQAPFHHLLPKDIQSKGHIKVASDIEYPPFETYGSDNKTVVGIDADIARALSKELGVKIKFVNSSFDALIPGLVAHRYDMAMSAMTDNKKRQEAVDFLDYFNAGGAILARTEDKDKYVKLTDLCGVSVGLDKGTTEVADANEQSKKCVANGKKPIKTQVFSGQNQMMLALESGRVDAAMADAPNAAATAAHSDGKLALTGPKYETSLFGIVFPKGSTQLEKAVQAALQKIMDNGTYMKILKKYGQEDNARHKATLNAGT